jgi:hypothetical protein
MLTPLKRSPRVRELGGWLGEPASGVERLGGRGVGVVGL